LALSATSDLLDFAQAEHRLSPATKAAAVRLLGDTLAVGAAGAMLSGPVERAASAWGTGDDSRLIGRGQRLPAPSAAFVNGFRIHCLEWDSVHAGAVVHALSVVTAALGAAIDRRGGCDPDDALSALAVGVDIAAGLGLASTGAMRFFRPATAGVIGAALAVARIEGSSRFGDVLGLAYSQAAGTMQAHVEGSIALPSRSAMPLEPRSLPSILRRRPRGPQDALEGAFGYFQLFEQGALSRYTRHGFGLADRRVSTKPYPSAAPAMRARDLGYAPARRRDHLGRNRIHRCACAASDPAPRRPAHDSGHDAVIRAPLPPLADSIDAERRAASIRGGSRRELCQLASEAGASLLSILPDENSDPNRAPSLSA
jgi:2-methylcitrate dehydratase PrpD